MCLINKEVQENLLDFGALISLEQIKADFFLFQELLIDNANN